MTYAYRLLPDGTGYVDSEGVHRGVPPTQEDFDLIALRCVHQTFFKEGPRELQGKNGIDMGVAMGEEPGEYGNKFTQGFDPSCGGALSGKTFTVEQADAIIKYVRSATHGYKERNEHI